MAARERTAKASSRRSVLVGVAAVVALIAAVFVPGGWAAVLVVLCLPVAAGALVLGRWAGLALAAVAEATAVAWDARGGNVGGTGGELVVAGVLVVLGFVLGALADAVRADRRRNREVARVRDELEEAQRVGGVGSWSWNAATGRSEWSAQMFRVYGAAPDEDPDSVLAAATDSRDLAQLIAARDRAVADRRPFEIEQRIQWPDGTPRQLLIRAEPIGGPDDDPVPFRGTTQDLTELRSAQRSAEAASEELAAVLASMLDAVVVGSAVRDDAGQLVDFRIDYANPEACRAYVRQREELVGHTVRAIWRDRPDATLLDAYIRLVETGEPVELVEHHVVVPDTDGLPLHRFIDLRAAPLGDGYVSVWRDVTARHRDAEHLAAASAQLEAAFDHAPVGMALLDQAGVVVRANPALAAITGRSVEELAGSSLESHLDRRDADANQALFDELLGGHAPSFRCEVRLVTADEGLRWVSLSAALARSPAGTFAVVHVQDIHERKSYEGRLRYLADHDALTGLFNRRRFHEELTHQVTIDHRSGRPSALILVDLDNFKYINDTLGHQVGDRLIQVIARALQARLRDTDVVGRLGGDEFAVLLPGVTESDAVPVTEALLAAVRSSSVSHAGQRVRSTGSAGIASGDGADPDDVLANADLAMYAAKEAGRNTFIVHDPKGPHAERSRAKFQWLDRIRHALERDLFTLHAQPIVAITTGEVTGCELLLRMLDDDELVAPDLFLPIAERHGLANAIDRWVIPRAIALVSTHAMPVGYRWEINLSADSLRDPTIPDLIASEVLRVGVEPASIVFEITETAAIANIDEAQAFAARITDIGCEFALDDFGAGYGSFYYLKHLPFEYLKVDGEFVRHLPTSATDRVIVESIVTAARRLGKRTIAEHVGDAETLELLRRVGVDYAQGNHMGRPAKLNP